MFSRKNVYGWKIKYITVKRLKNGYVFTPDLFRRYNAIVLKGYDPDVIRSQVDIYADGTTI